MNLSCIPYESITFHLSLHNARYALKFVTAMHQEDEYSDEDYSENYNPNDLVYAEENEEEKEMPGLVNSPPSSDDDEGDNDDEEDAPPSPSALITTTPDRNRGRLDTRDHPIARQQVANGWCVSPAGESGYFKLTHQSQRYSSIGAVIPSNRLKKAKEKLNPLSIDKVLTSSASCTCTRNPCAQKFGFNFVLQCRLVLFGDPDLCTEQKVTEKAVSILSADNPTANVDKMLVYSVQSSGSQIKVCSRFWAALYGVCESKMKTIRHMVKNKTSSIVHGLKWKVSHSSKTSQFDVSYAFWQHFFDKNCQRPTETLRLFPVNKPFHVVYSEYFLPWFNKRNARLNSGAPSDEQMWPPHMSSFMRARHHPDFADVAKRPKHYHCKCNDCFTLNEIRLRGFLNDQHKKEYEISVKAHEAEARGWHLHEEAVKAVTRRFPREVMVLGYDDTSDLGLPKITNRSPKNLTQYVSRSFSLLPLPYLYLTFPLPLTYLYLTLTFTLPLPYLYVYLPQVPGEVHPFQYHELLQRYVDILI